MLSRHDIILTLCLAQTLIMKHVVNGCKTCSLKAKQNFCLHHTEDSSMLQFRVAGWAFPGNGSSSFALQPS